jgi:hypothetical protein
VCREPAAQALSPLTASELPGHGAQVNWASALTSSRPRAGSMTIMMTATPVWVSESAPL